MAFMSTLIFLAGAWNQDLKLLIRFQEFFFLLKYRFQVVPVRGICFDIADRRYVYATL